MEFFDRPITIALGITISALGFNMMSTWVRAIPALYGEDRIIPVLQQDLDKLNLQLKSLMPRGLAARPKSDADIASERAQYSGIFFIFIAGTSLFSAIALFYTLKYTSFLRPGSAAPYAFAGPFGALMAVGLLMILVLPTTVLYKTLIGTIKLHGAASGAIRFSLWLHMFSVILGALSAVVFTQV